MDHIECKIGNAAAKLLPHYLPLVGPRVFVEWIGPTHQILSPAELRALAMTMTLAAGAAESAQRRAQIKTQRRQAHETSPV